MTERETKRALITRPQEDAEDAATALARLGIEAVVAPLMRIEYAQANIENEVSLAQAILFTSRNGVRAFSRLSARRDIAILTVGDSTADLARDNGFVDIKSARGDSKDLARLVIDRLDPADGLLFHPAGANVAGDLTDTLNKAGFKSLRRALYEAKAKEVLDDETTSALRDRKLDYVLFFSPRTGRIFSKLVEQERLAQTCNSLTAISLSEAVASEIAGLSWGKTITAQLPTTEALLSVISKLEATGSPPVTTFTPVAGTYNSESTPEPRDTRPDSSTAFANPLEVHKSLDFDRLDKTGEPFLQSTAKEEDAGRPGESAMIQPAPYRAPVEPPAISSADKPTERSSVPSSTLPQAAADAENELDTTELQVAAAVPPIGNPSRSWIGTVLVTLVAVIVVLGVGYSALPSWRNHLPPAVQDHLAGTAGFSESLQRNNNALADRVAEMSAKLQAKDAKIAAVRRRIAEMKKRADDGAALIAKGEEALAEMRAKNTGGAAAAGENAALRGRVALLNKFLTEETEARTEAEAAQQKAETLAATRADTAAKLTATVDEANGKISVLENKLDEARKAALLAGKPGAIVVAAQKLRDALAGNASFSTEIRGLKETAGEAPAVAAILGPIEPLASSGVATQNDLLGHLPATVAAVVAATRQPKSNDWIDRSISKLANLVTIRRIDGKGRGADAIVARAEMAARGGDLTAAVTELSTLTGPGATAAADWLNLARNRLAVDRTRRALDKIILNVAVAGDRS